MDEKHFTKVSASPEGEQKTKKEKKMTN